MNITDIGRELKAAREAANITVETVAKALCLTTEQIEHLENNRFEALAAPTYVAGYIRSYCHEVAVSPDDFVQAYMAKDEVTLPELNLTSNQPRQINARSPLFVTATALVMLIMLGLISFWAWETFQEIKTENAQIEAAANNALPEIELVLEPTENQAVNSDTSEAALDEIYAADVLQAPLADNIDNVDASLDATAAAATAETIESLTNNATLSNNTEAAINERAALTQVENSTNAVEAAAEETSAIEIQVLPSGIAPIGNDRIIIEVDDEAWVDVQDSNGYRLYYGMRYANQGSLFLAGQAPFNIVLGDARVTRVTLNDTPFNVSRFIRADNSARFRLQ